MLINMKPITLLLSLTVFCALSSCVAHVHPSDLQGAHGFWMGLWHGIIAPITFIISLFSDTITVWDTNNNGCWYTFGFLLGFGILGGGGSTASKK